MTSIVGVTDTASLIGFGRSVNGVPVVLGNIDLQGAPLTSLNFAFSMPRAGTITSLAGYFSNVVPLALVGTIATVHIQLYQSAAPGPNNTLVPIPGAVVDLILTNNVAGGDVFSGIVALAIPITVESRILLGVTVTSTGFVFAGTVTGYISGGLAIV